MALTTDQRTDLQGDLGITADETVFTNDELDRLFTRAGADYNLAVYYGWRSLMADAAKLYKYTVAQTSVGKDQVFDHIKDMVRFWQEESRTVADQVAMVGITTIPPNWKDYPATDEPCSPTRDRRYLRVSR